MILSKNALFLILTLFSITGYSEDLPLLSGDLLRLWGAYFVQDTNDSKKIKIYTCDEADSSSTVFGILYPNSGNEYLVTDHLQNTTVVNNYTEFEVSDSMVYHITHSADTLYEITCIVKSRAELYEIYYESNDGYRIEAELSSVFNIYSQEDTITISSDFFDNRYFRLVIVEKLVDRIKETCEFLDHDMLLNESSIFNFDAGDTINFPPISNLNNGDLLLMEALCCPQECTNGCYGGIRSQTMIVGDITSAYLQGSKQYNYKIYPNPTSNHLSIISDAKIEQINITDLTGKRLKKITTNLNVVDVGNLPSGIYFVELITEDKRIVKRFIKK